MMESGLTKYNFKRYVFIDYIKITCKNFYALDELKNYFLKLFPGIIVKEQTVVDLKQHVEEDSDNKAFTMFIITHSCLHFTRYYIQFSSHSADEAVSHPRFLIWPVSNLKNYSLARLDLKYKVNIIPNSSGKGGELNDSYFREAESGFNAYFKKFKIKKEPALYKKGLTQTLYIGNRSKDPEFGRICLFSEKKLYLELELKRTGSQKFFQCIREKDSFSFWYLAHTTMLKYCYKLPKVTLMQPFYECAKESLLALSVLQWRSLRSLNQPVPKFWIYYCSIYKGWELLDGVRNFEGPSYVTQYFFKSGAKKYELDVFFAILTLFCKKKLTPLAFGKQERMILQLFGNFLKPQKKLQNPSFMRFDFDAEEVCEVLGWKYRTSRVKEIGHVIEELSQQEVNFPAFFQEDFLPSKKVYFFSKVEKRVDSKRRNSFSLNLAPELFAYSMSYQNSLVLYDGYSKLYRWCIKQKEFHRPPWYFFELWAHIHNLIVTKKTHLFLDKCILKLRTDRELKEATKWAELILNFYVQFSFLASFEFYLESFNQNEFQNQNIKEIPFSLKENCYMLQYNIEGLELATPVASSYQFLSAKKTKNFDLPDYYKGPVFKTQYTAILKLTKTFPEFRNSGVVFH